MNYSELKSFAEVCGGAVRNKDGWLCRCPAHDDKKPSLSLSLDNGKLLAHCFAGCSFDDIVKAVPHGSYSTQNTNRQNEHTANQRQKQDNTDFAQRIWRESRPAHNSIVQTYLGVRGYNQEIPSCLRYHPCLHHSQTNKKLPAMVAGVTLFQNETIIAIHRTFLNATGAGKAPVEPDKMMLGPTAGGAVMFGARYGDSLIVAEGIETALSLFLATGLPTWAALSTSGMKQIMLPSVEQLPRLYIAADNDLFGLQAAEVLEIREISRGREVRKIIPPLPGQDFNDVLRGEYVR